MMKFVIFSVLLVVLPHYSESGKPKEKDCPPEEQPLQLNFEPCPDTSDLNCIGDRSTKFISLLAKGNKPLDIEPMDPLNIEEVETKIVEGMTVYYKNFTMTGFANLVDKILSFDFGGLAVEQLTFDYEATSAIIFEGQQDCNKHFSGHYDSQGTAVVTVPIRFGTKNDPETGELLFDVKPAQGTECKIKNHPKPKFELNSELVDALNNDPDKDVQTYIKKRNDCETEVFEKELCIILKQAVADVLIPGIQKGTQEAPVSAFFKSTDKKEETCDKCTRTNNDKKSDKKSSGKGGLLNLNLFGIHVGLK